MRIGYIGMTQDDISCSDLTKDCIFTIIGIGVNRTKAIIEYINSSGKPRLVYAHVDTLKVKL